LRSVTSHAPIAPSREDELTALREQADSMAAALEEVKQRIEALTAEAKPVE
jgi:hypothetical protein